MLVLLWLIFHFLLELGLQLEVLVFEKLHVVEELHQFVLVVFLIADPSVVEPVFMPPLVVGTWLAETG